ncbi:MAG: hypothetical protein K0R26_18 [Bacteroidota bacterium]|jgi:hypothetical protein|nr:hypothetical protein [Bacteroidota bacterium]
MAWNEGLSDGFWGAVSANVGQVIGAVSGTTNHQADAQIAMANQNRAEQQQNTSFLQSLFANNNSNSTLARNGLTSQLSPQMMIIIALVIIMIIGAMMRARR